MIVLQIDKNEVSLINELKATLSLESKIVEKRNFSGQQELVDFICKLTPISLPLIAHVINTAIKSKKQIIIKHKGLTIKGLSEKNSIKILEKIIEKNGDT